MDSEEKGWAMKEERKKEQEVNGGCCSAVVADYTACNMLGISQFYVSSSISCGVISVSVRLYQ